MVAIEGNSSGYAAMLPTNITPEKFIRTCKTAISKNPDLLQCTKPSLFLAVEEAARDGLIIDGKEAALVKFNSKKKIGNKEVWVSEAKYMPMTAGLMKLARNSGDVLTPIAEIIYEKDVFEYYIQNGAVHLKHKPNIFSDRGEAVGVYATCQMKSGECVAEVLTVKQVGAIKSKSKSQNSLMWTTFWEEAWKKSAFRRMWKRLPNSSDKEGERFESAVTRVDDDYNFDNEVVEASTGQEESIADVTPAHSKAKDEKPKKTRAEAAVEEKLAKAKPKTNDNLSREREQPPVDVEVVDETPDNMSVVEELDEDVPFDDNNQEDIF